MAMLNYIIWNPNQAIFHIGSFAVRWYGLGVLLAFLGGSQLVKYVYQKEKRPLEDAERLSLWILVSALVGARLGEIIFYNFKYYLSHPLEAFLPVTFDPHFKFTGYQGLSYHGAIIGTFIGTYLYANYHIQLQLFSPRLSIKKQMRKGQNFLWLSTPLALALMMGFLVRLGNFFNSEITGTPTQNSYGVLFAHDVATQLQNSSAAITQIKIRKSNT
ncbi:MAG: prolipoprotein diacylglyceryl transferase, partial [Bacteroidota bacterium]